MEKLKLNIKTLLIITAAVFLLFIISIYLKTTVINLELFKDSNQPEAEMMLMEKDKKNENLTKVEKPEEKKEKIEKIVLLEEITDPFKSTQKPEASRLNVPNDKSENNNLNLHENQDLILLEKNIISKKITGSENQFKQKAKNKAETFSESLQIEKEDAAENEKGKKAKTAALNRINKIKLPFELLGIIRNKSNAAALFLYQGQNILKNEKDKIDLFKIKKINNKEVILTYQKEELRLQLWEAKENEN